MKVEPLFFDSKLEIDITMLIRFRDFISHHYEKMDSEIVFDICKNEVSLLKQKVSLFLITNADAENVWEIKVKATTLKKTAH